MYLPAGITFHVKSTHSKQRNIHLSQAGKDQKCQPCFGEGWRVGGLVSRGIGGTVDRGGCLGDPLEFVRGGVVDNPAPYQRYFKAAHQRTDELSSKSALQSAVK